MHMTGFNNLNAGLFIYAIAFQPIGFPITLPLESYLESDFAIQYVNISSSFIFRNLIITNILIHPRNLENGKHEK